MVFFCGDWCRPLDYMLLRALEKYGRADMAHEVAKAHVDLCSNVYLDTGTFWDCYSAEREAQAVGASPGYCGWSALGPVAMLIEYVLGFRIDAPARTLVWQLQLSEAHGAENLKVGGTRVHLQAAYTGAGSYIVRWRTDGPLRLVLVSAKGRVELELEGDSRGSTAI